MKSITAFVVLCSILLLGNLSYARKDAGDYWKSIMKNQPMPDAIKDLFHEEGLPSLPPGSAKRDRFVKDFDVRPNVIIYHSSHSQPEGVLDDHMPSVHEFQTKHHQQLQQVINQIRRD
ncbi:Organ specific protein [Parasponia andersonii]|uniref:Organ specific protein n=1 Tax=Parasponia andersonii TaxID=3476 RepID=A0A2P5DU74_PARAD|nr:Organ specific protein [Parasponia andersonii]